MTKLVKILPYIIVIALTVFIFKQCESNKEFKSKISVLEDEKDSLSSLYLKLDKVNDSILNIKNKTIVEYKTIYKYKKQLQDEAHKIDSVVYSLNEQQIDSTIRTYKHINRTKD